MTFWYIAKPNIDNHHHISKQLNSLQVKFNTFTGIPVILRTLHVQFCCIIITSARSN